MTLVNDSYYDAITVTSPMYDGQDKKDQDRVAWSPAAPTACLCDGVTSSPFSAEAAWLACIYSRILFPDDTQRRLRAFCDLLLALRDDKLNSEISLSADTPQMMQGILRDAARQNLAVSFQTTLVAANFAPDDKVVVCSVIRCGDSMFLAFGSDGEHLASSPSGSGKSPPVTKQSLKDRPSSSPCRGIGFGPGEEVLARVVCDISKYPHVAKESGIATAYMENWLICEVLDKCAGKSRKKKVEELNALHLERGDLLIVPRYLAGTAIRIKSRSYVRLLYSRTIRPIRTNAATVDFQHHTAATEVLPDHFYTGCWSYFQDRFPLDAHFVLASDGFYGCFKDAANLWSWLAEHKQHLQEPRSQEMLLECLHGKLQREYSDDDISFVWVFPRQKDGKDPNAVEPVVEKGTHNDK